MSRTYTWEDVLAYLYQNVPRVSESQVGPLVCNQILNMMWDKCDWRETMADMPPWHPIAGEQDHYSPLVCAPSDFRGLRKAQIFGIASDPPFEKALLVTKDLKETWYMALPDDISYDTARQCFRLFPRFPEGLDPTDWVIQCTYKKNPTKVTGATINSVIPFDDHYFQTLVDVGHYCLAKTDPRRIREYEALRAQAEYSLERKAAEEGINLGDQPIAPQFPLDAFKGGWYR